MLTSFGKLCRKLRIDNGELLKDMADKLGVTSAYLSAVETGKRNVPKDWPERITKMYSLDEIKSKELKEAAAKSQINLKLELENLDESDKDLMLAFARQFNQLTDTDKNKIKQILSKISK